MSYKVSALDLGNLTGVEDGSVAEILRNVAIILSTKQGEVPMHRGLGIPPEIVDRPAPVAQILLISAIKEAVETYEPRASVEFQSDATTPEKLIPIVEVTING
jgi:phage baseplate assembly protein W